MGAASHSPLFVFPRGMFCLGCVPSVFAFTFYCKLLNKGALLILKNPIFRFSHQGKKKPSRDSQGHKEPCLLPGSASASVWVIRRAQTSTRSCNMFFAWGPGIPNELLGIRKNPSYCKQHTCMLFEIPIKITHHRVQCIS